MTLTTGQLIKTTYGRYYRVWEVWDNVVYTYEGARIHISNIIEAA